MRLIRSLAPVLLTLTLTLASGAIGPAPTRGQDRAPAKPTGTPAKANVKAVADDKAKEKARPEATPAPTGLFPRGYPDHDALTAALRRAAGARPDRVRLTTLATTARGRDVWLVTVGAAETAGAARPAVLVVANLEADHVVGSLVALALIERLAAAKGDAAAWLDRVTVHVVPRLNPDGADRALAAPSVEFRTNLRPVDRDRDGRRGEDGPDDLNGDGVVTRMRVNDPKTATLIADEKDPRILRRADPAKGERAVYSEEDEGRDDDGDGLRNEDPRGGVNLNRNWPQRWTEFDPEAGSSPASEPEVFALIAFAFAHPEIAAVWSFGLNDNLRDEPKKPGSTLDDADLPLLAELSRIYARTTAAADPPKGGSPAGKGSAAPDATTDGALSEWAYHQFGAVGLASRLWTTPEVPPPAPEKGNAEAKAKGKAQEKVRAVPDDGEARWLYWNDHVTGGRAFVPFAPFEHPTLGRVEIGGWRPGVRLNPAVEQVGPLAESHLAFLKELASRFPKLDLAAVKVEAKGGGLFEIRAAVENAGFLPTAMAQGVRTRKAPQVLVRLDPGKAKLLAGRPLERIDALAGSGGRREFRWLVQAPEGVASVRLDVSCPRAGRVVRTVELK